ncbi:MAG: hypothetical protein H7318_11990 [Oligoflexus sp.]|nr:hypothetical protein [Oligoflexus sp.]
MNEKSSIKKIKDLFTPLDAKRDLPYLLSLASPEMSYELKLEWFAMLRAWIMAPVQDGQRSPHTRIRFILQFLDRHPEWKKNVGLVLFDMLKSCRGFSSFAYLGLFEEKGFVDQVAGLLLERVLPLPKSPQDLSEWLEHIFPERDDAEWVESLPIPVLHEILALIQQNSAHAQIFPHFREDLLAAMQVLAIQVASMGSTPSLWMRIGSPTLDQLPFWRLEQGISSVCTRIRAEGEDIDWSEINLAAIHVDLKACEMAMNQAFTYLQTNGVNTGLVLRMEHILMHLKRLGFLVNQLEATKEGRGNAHGLTLLAELIRAQYDATNFKQLLKGNLQMLSLRVVEHTGSSGEHYITRTKAEYFSMLKSASGGGFLTVVTTALKYGIAKLMLPAFIEAICQWGNYALSFLAMQALHFTLATKQPSMTAAALANKIKQSKGTKNNLGIALEIRHIIRSQFAAVLGNLGLAVPTALAFSYAFTKLKGYPFFDLDYAKHTIESLHPIRTLTLFYAAETGVVLWLSSLVAGWCENWLAYQQVPERLARNMRIRRAFGADAGKSMAGFLKRNISGITGNIVLGFFLSAVPFLGKITGLPLGISHVTLSSASLAISVVSLGDKVIPMEVATAALGVLGIGFLNFSISFYLALMVARYAQNISDRMFLSIRKRVFQLFTWQPLAFFYPNKASEDNEGEKLPITSHH